MPKIEEIDSDEEREFIRNIHKYGSAQADQGSDSTFNEEDIKEFHESNSTRRRKAPQKSCCGAASLEPDDPLELEFQKEDDERARSPWTFIGKALTTALIVVILVGMVVEGLGPVLKMFGSSKSSAPPKYRPFPSATSQPIPKTLALHTVKELQKMSGKELRILLWQRSVSTRGATEKKEFVDLIINRIVTEDLNKLSLAQLQDLLRNARVRFQPKDKKADLIKKYLSS
ncbi:uncharacterized protein BJ171DRAFT_520408 [Polychytrium aggregatum]|uniref:uncharacterized protein n=1 Tax=Polychytrium aggregatum TaxID=110093 RepID=UPI0022FE863F|nr:uncharacterized protein BJ171DRAFT_520408 [Polychytrium aggregatum]KAI9197261.1 hypothetical protein BJ171DRAFT_520408 [Polychytrium aggregatum]